MTLLIFPILRQHLGDAGTFWFFAALALLNFLYAKFQVPETKGLSLEQIEHLWLRKS